MTDEQIVKSFKELRESINDLTLRMEQMLLALHNDNSNAIDDIIVNMLGGGTNEG